MEAAARRAKAQRAGNFFPARHPGPSASDHSSFPSNHCIRHAAGGRHSITSEFSTGLVRAPGGVVAEEVAATVAT